MSLETLSTREWRRMQQKMPIPCFDFVPVQRDDSGALTHYGLILRRTPFPEGSLWCHLGGRVRKDETTRQAVLRHLDQTLMTQPAPLPQDPQPQYVMQWFQNPAIDLDLYGRDPRKHAISQCFVLTIDASAKARPNGEGLEFCWFNITDVPPGVPLWPGTRHLLEKLLEDGMRDSTPLSDRTAGDGGFISKDSLALSYQVLADRALMHNTLMWQTPGLSVAAEAFLLTLALSPGASPVSRCFTAGLSLVLSLLCIQLMSKHSAMEQRDRALLNSLEAALHATRTEGAGPKFRGLARLRSRTLWHVGLGIFAAASCFIIVATVYGVNWFR